MVSTGHTTNEFLFTGQQFDAAIGQYYLRARYYSETVGQFTSRDSYDGQITEPITENHYAYARSDPMDWVDSSGMDGTATEEGVTASLATGIAALFFVGLGAFALGLGLGYLASVSTPGSAGIGRACHKGWCECGYPC